ncbi:MAG: FecR domain-containing protein [Chitinophagaceae bacterium]|nr:FecR domain-containing protein [Chitinophagaceae bacterium]
MPEFNQLLDKYLRNELEGDELQAFLEAARQHENIEALRDAVMQKLRNKPLGLFSDAEQIELMFEQMLQKSASPPKMPEALQVVPLHTSRWRRLTIKVAAASIVVLLSAGAYFWATRPAKSPPLAKAEPVINNDVAPGGNKAILTLSDGTTIDLNDAAKGTLAKQGNASVIKNTDGELVYRLNDRQPPALYYNTVTTPRGGQYKLVLPDGTQVWLNASSSIRYPTVFNEQERKVMMEGEAYFEVAHNKEQPFIVSANGTEVHVTGTHFNINAYADESAIKTTLLEGAVTVKKGATIVKLLPGNQVETNDKGLSEVKAADIEETVAWKNGLFSFNGDDLPSIMRQLARWYNLEVHYEGAIPKRLFAGKVFRNMNLSETLKVFELSNVHFRIEGNKLTVIP